MKVGIILNEVGEVVKAITDTDEHAVEIEVVDLANFKPDNAYENREKKTAEYVEDFDVALEDAVTE